MRPGAYLAVCLICSFLSVAMVVCICPVRQPFQISDFALLNRSLCLGTKSPMFMHYNPPVPALLYLTRAMDFGHSFPLSFKYSLLGSGTRRRTEESYVMPSASDRPASYSFGQPHKARWKSEQTKLAQVGIFRSGGVKAIILSLRLPLFERECHCDNAVPLFFFNLIVSFIRVAFQWHCQKAGCASCWMKDREQLVGHATSPINIFPVSRAFPPFPSRIIVHPPFTFKHEDSKVRYENVRVAKSQHQRRTPHSAAKWEGDGVCEIPRFLPAWEPVASVPGAGGGALPESSRALTTTPHFSSGRCGAGAAGTRGW